LERQTGVMSDSESEYLSHKLLLECVVEAMAMDSLSYKL
jgi:hypothetical protein